MSTMEYVLCVAAAGDETESPAGTRPLIHRFETEKAAIAARDFFRANASNTLIIYDGQGPKIAGSVVG